MEQNKRELMLLNMIKQLEFEDIDDCETKIKILQNKLKEL